MNNRKESKKVRNKSEKKLEIKQIQKKKESGRTLYKNVIKRKKKKKKNN